MYAVQPACRLRHARPGDTVKLTSGPASPLFHGGYDGEYALLYTSQQHYAQGRPWVAMASQGLEIAPIASDPGRSPGPLLSKAPRP